MFIEHKVQDLVFCSLMNLIVWHQGNSYFFFLYFVNINTILDVDMTTPV